MQRCTRRALILQRIERRPTILVECHYLAVDHRIVGHRCKRLDDARIPRIEIVLFRERRCTLPAFLKVRRDSRRA
jgi:hypothetical protein